MNNLRDGYRISGVRESTYVVRELEVLAPGIHRLNGDLHYGCPLLLFARERQTKKCLQQLHEVNQIPEREIPADRARRLGTRARGASSCDLFRMQLENPEPEPESGDVPRVHMPQRPRHTLFVALCTYVRTGTLQCSG